MAEGLEFLTRDELLQKIDAGDFALWQLTTDSWALTEEMHTRYGRTLNVLTIVGTRAEWELGLAALERIAVQERYSYIYSMGHPGWKRLVEAAGWTTARLMRMTKRVTK